MLPNLSQLRIRDATVPTAGTGGGPGGGGGAGRELYNQEDLLALIADYLRRSEPSAVPRNRQMPCLIRMALTVNPNSVRFNFEVKIECNGNTLPTAQTITGPLIDAFMAAFEKSLDPMPTSSREVIETIRNNAQVDNVMIWPDGELANPNNAVYALSYRASQVKARDAFEALKGTWKSSKDVEAFMNELYGALFLALGITALPETYETIGTSDGPGLNTFVIAAVGAVRDVDVPETLPLQGVDTRLQELLDTWRAQEKARREAT